MGGHLMEALIDESVSPINVFDGGVAHRVTSETVCVRPALILNQSRTSSAAAGVQPAAGAWMVQQQLQQCRP